MLEPTPEMLRKSLRPMLAAGKPADFTDEAFIAKLRFPAIASPKVDGIRCITLDLPNKGNCFPATRFINRIQNQVIFEALSVLPAFLDGELASGNFQESTSAIMSFDGPPGNWAYHVFDYWAERQLPYDQRLAWMERLLKNTVPKELVDRVKPLEWRLVNSYEELVAYDQENIARGFEGTILRGIKNRYKNGRSTLNEGGMIKIKRFADAEAIVVGYEQFRHNANAAEKTPQGYTKRSSVSAGFELREMLGSLTVKTTAGVQFNVGTGFTEADRKELWALRSTLVGKIIKYKFQPHGVKDRPRCPVFLGFRAPGDVKWVYDKDVGQGELPFVADDEPCLMQQVNANGPITTGLVCTCKRCSVR